MESECGGWVGLVGMSGVGKTSAGSELARRLGWGFVDLDEAIGSASGQSAGELFSAEGEAGFRRWECRALEASLGMDSVVVALGAGAPTWGPTREVIMAARRRGALVFWLDEEDGLIARRLGRGAGRPLLAGAVDMEAAVAAQRRGRDGAYGEVSGQRICPGGLCAKGAAEMIAEAMGLGRRPAG